MWRESLEPAVQVFESSRIKSLITSLGGVNGYTAPSGALIRSVQRAWEFDYSRRRQKSQKFKSSFLSAHNSNFLFLPLFVASLRCLFCCLSCFHRPFSNLSTSSKYGVHAEYMRTIFSAPSSARLVLSNTTCPFSWAEPKEPTSYMTSATPITSFTTIFIVPRGKLVIGRRSGPSRYHGTVW